ncbi:hydroxymethylglutaryl-CoA lyase [Sulfitobacter sp. 1A12779]|uniref:hydroxymethylglutaryl-CoA lyase n=1 Tax=Sulfitobacter sp. 1A12779 TaxID=3368599 RepID=UPI003745C751
MNSKTVEIVEVSPRDGIQNDNHILKMDTKLLLIQRAIAAGARRIEVTSFVNPKKVPQMADAEELAAALPRGQARYIGLALNRRGFDRAVAAKLDEVNFAVVLSDTFSYRNQGMSTGDGIALWHEVAHAAEEKIGTGLTLAAAFGCPFEGEMPVARMIEVLEKALQEMPAELTLADTIGVAAPSDILERVGAVKARWPDLPIRLHLHNTRNTGFANAWAGLQAGVRSFDASLGGVGGCPFAPRATGNIATEDLAYMLGRAGYDTGWDIERAAEAARWLEAELGHEVPGMVMKAGTFPPASKPSN